MKRVQRALMSEGGEMVSWAPTWYWRVILPTQFAHCSSGTPSIRAQCSMGWVFFRKLHRIGLPMPVQQVAQGVCSCNQALRASIHARYLHRAAIVRCQTTGQPRDQSDHYYMGLALQQAEKAFQCEEVPIGAVIVSGSEVVSMACNETEKRRNPLCHAELMCIMSAAEKLQAWRLQDATLYCTLEPCPMCAGAILQARLKRLVYGAKQPRLGADGSWVSLFPQQQQQTPEQLQQPNRQQHSSLAAEQACAGQPKLTSPSAEDRSCPDLESSAQLEHTPSTAPDCQPTHQQGQQESIHQHQRQLEQQQCIVPKGSHPFHPGILVTSGVREEECRAIMQLFFRQRRQQQRGVKAAPLHAEN